MDVPLDPRDQFSQLFMFEYANKNTGTFCLSSFDTCVICQYRAGRYQVRYTSRTTSPGFLSSRNPMKTGARNFPSRVHSANLISATNFGLIQ